MTKVQLFQEFGNHDNIIKLLNVIRADNDKDIYLVFEYMGKLNFISFVTTLLFTKSGIPLYEEVSNQINLENKHYLNWNGRSLFFVSLYDSD